MCVFTFSFDFIQSKPLVIFSYTLLQLGSIVIPIFAIYVEHLNFPLLVSDYKQNCVLLDFVSVLV